MYTLIRTSGGREVPLGSPGGDSQQAAIIDLLVASMTTATQALSRKAHEVRLLEALSTLPEDQREAIILIGASGFSYEEAAEICGCAVGTIKSRVSRARTRLQEILKISGEDEYGPDAISAQVTGSNAA